MDIDDLAKQIYLVILESEMESVDATYIVTKFPITMPIGNIQKAINRLIEQGVIEWETRDTYGDTIYVVG